LPPAVLAVFWAVAFVALVGPSFTVVRRVAMTHLLLPSHRGVLVRCVFSSTATGQR
jgi:hypothetical protein